MMRQKCVRAISIGVIVLSLQFACLGATRPHYPVTVKSCGRDIVIKQRPRCAVFHDVNMAEMGFALHLQPYMCGVTGITGWNKETVAFHQSKGRIPELAPRYPTLEQLLFYHTDLFVAGWNYGMTLGGRVTPESLASFGIPVAVLSESCLHQSGYARLPVTFDALLFDDLRRLGQIFDVEHAADTVIKSLRARLVAVQRRTHDRKTVRVFVYDSGDAAPMTAGRYALVTRMIEAAGGRNVMDDLPTNWGATSWETVAHRRVEAVIFVDYGTGTRAARRLFETKRLLTYLPVVQKHRFISISYDALTPGPHSIDAVETLATFLHPDALQ